jgi:endonuclease/exonuclease/phosphatase family metal-dependent hydrolase
MKFALALLLLGMATSALAVEPPAADTLTVVTLNLWHDQGDWPKRLAKIVAGLRALSPDVICLQEVLQHPGLPNQAGTLAESLGCSAHFVSVDPPERPKRYGNAILTPHRVLGTGGRFLLPLDDWRVVAHVRVEVRGRPVDVYDTHLHHTREGGAIRAAQIRDLLAFVDSTRSAAPVVLAGDFNCELGSPELAPVEEAWTDAFAFTHPGARHEDAVTLNVALGNLPMAIDHVFVPRADRARLMPASAAIVLNDPGGDGVWPSDHFGVVVKLARAESGAAPRRAGADPRGR